MTTASLSGTFRRGAGGGGGGVCGIALATLINGDIVLVMVERHNFTLRCDTLVKLRHFDFDGQRVHHARLASACKAAYLLYL